MQPSAPSSPRAVPSRNYSAALLSVTIVAALLRLHDVAADGLTSDEAFSWRLVGYPWLEMLRRAAADVHPPLYYLLLKPWLAFYGDAPLVLRGLSVLLGAMVVPLTYALVREAQGLLRGEDQGRAIASRGAALLAALVVALHPTQVLASQNARMYSLSAVLSVLATLLLLRALRRGRGWIVYGLAAAAVCGAHYYGFFTIAGHVLGAGLLLVRADGQGSLAPTRTSVRGAVLAAATAALAYAAWLPAFIGQVTRVSASYWIPPVTWERVAVALACWATGLERVALGGAAPGIAVLVVGLALLAAWRAQRVVLFLLVSAGSPWVLSLAFSVATSRSIFLPRYLVPVQIFLLVLLVLSAMRPRALWLRSALALALVSLCVLCLARAKAQVPDEPLAEARAAQFLAQRYQEGDVILTDSPRASNRLRYYLAQQGVRTPTMHCLLSASADNEEVGHFVHTASLASDELVAAERLDAADWRRLWWGTPTSVEQRLPSARWQQVVIRHIASSGTHYMLSRYVRVERVAADAKGQP
jgi:mannosyltransferase